MKKILIGLLLICTSLSLAGCENMTKADVGTLSGAAIGGLVGSRFGGGGGQILATGAGAVIGALIGNSVGRNMDEADRMRMCRAFENNGDGEPAYWRNQRSGACYTVTPVRNVCVDGNRYCREYRTTAIIAGKKQQLYGTACRQPDGTWEIVK